ncbi:T9SS type A sorting domain-containing protein [Winogradskyella echinorum]|uniref:T9SS type A sorting domain-containing protein n=1 Tax=Winogradskyella echinorum TaxID=538189 RepID=A0ABR6XZ65_9FLAO|nr:T9SS type A sorting domain-containing protein [Winogradskyella echinorum]MBC3845777.1 T9SS type A sorting domain-containing protein [Winogradskyella echinorum]MBC5750125.1 T9SS type A sorting domain-containing protein [Winogradskyella echinorum]
MKKLLLLFILFPFLAFSQVQIGSDIDGLFPTDYCGWSVSSSSDGTKIAISAPSNDGNGSNSGHVRIYENNNGNWTQIGNDIDGEASEDFSGSSISLSSNGNIIAIGADRNDGNGSNSGHVRIYENNNGNWTQIGNDIDGEALEDFSGSSISLSSNGNIIAIGADRNDGNGSNSGHVRIYENNNGNWTQIGNDIDGEASEDFSGSSISLSSNGNIVAIGAPYNDGNGNNSGHVRIYENIIGNWIQIGNDINGEALDDYSGWSVSLSSDGVIVAIGARYNSGNGYRSGHVRVYENIGGNWTQLGDDIDGEFSTDLSGSSVSISSNGEIVAIGAPVNNYVTGHVRVYQKINGNWTQIGSDIDGEDTYNDFGWSISLSTNGLILVVGAISNNDNGNNSGHARVFDLSTILSTDEQTLTSFKLFPNPTKNQFTIQLDNSNELKIVSIYNNLGQLVLTTKESTIDSSKLSAGIYVLEIETNNGKGTKKLIIE